MAKRRTPEWKKLLMPSDRPGQEELLGAIRVPVAGLVNNPEQPRKGELTGIEELAESIQRYGLLQPILVSSPVAGRSTIIAGHRRVAAFRWLAQHDTQSTKWDTIPAIEWDEESPDRLVLALVENLARENLTDAEILAGISVLRDQRDWPQQEIAGRLGVTKGWISKYFRVGEDPDVALHVQAGELSTSTAYEIVVAKSPEAKRAALEVALAGATRQTVRAAAGGEFRGETGATSTDSDGGDNGHADPSAASAPADEKFRRETSESRGVGAAVTPGVRDLAEVAAEHDLRVRLRDTELGKLIRAALEEGTDDVRLADFIKLLRADMRTAQALVRAQTRRQDES